MNKKQYAIVIAFMLILIVATSFFCNWFIMKAFAKTDECVKTKYETTYDRYGILTSSIENRDWWLKGRVWVDLGNCSDNNKKLKLYRTPAEESISLLNQKKLNGTVEAELTAVEEAIELLKKSGFTIIKQ